MSISILNLFQDILGKADQSSIREGKYYFSGGHVQNLNFSPGKITADVPGNRGYKVTLSFSTEKGSSFTCSCSFYYHPCKHVIATILAAQQYASRKNVSIIPAASSEDYLALVGIEKDFVRLKTVKNGKEFINTSHSIESKVKIHSLLREHGERFNSPSLGLEGEEIHFLISKRAFLKILNKAEILNIYFKKILNANFEPLRVVYLKKTGGAVLFLYREGKTLFLGLKYQGETISISPENFLSLDDGDFCFTGKELLSVPYASVLAGMSKFHLGSPFHSFLIHYLSEKLAEIYALENFDQFPAPLLEMITPAVRVILEEERRSNYSDIFLSVRMEFKYGSRIVPEDEPSPFILIKKKCVLRDLVYEKKAAGRLFKGLDHYMGKLHLQNALEFLFKKLPALPADWKIIKKLDYFDFEDTSKTRMTLESGENTDWFNISFHIPEQMRKKFSKNLLLQILRKKTKYINAYGKWIHCSEELVRSLSIAYFIGPHVLTEEHSRISAFQVMGLWLYFKDREQDKIPSRVRETIEKLNNFKGISLPAFSPRLDQVLRPYQKEGVAWLEFLHEHNLSGILCDDMGLGKTLQTLAFLWNLKQKSELKQCVVVAPTSAVVSWRAEIEKFLPDFKVAVLGGPRGEREGIYAEWEKYEIFLISYSLFYWDIEELKKKEINYVILDEAQFIKNANTKRARSLFAIKSQRRLALTGTPLENRLSDLWSIFHFLMPGYLGSLEYFKDIYQNPIEKRGETERLEQLREKTRPFLLRRLKEEVEKELPPKTETPIFCELTDEQKKIYLHTLSLVKEEVFESINTKGIQQSYIHIFAALTKLRQICDHPALVFDKPSAALTSGKFEAFKERLLEAVEEKHCTLVFSQFTAMLKHIKEWLDKEKIPYLYLDGATKNRAEIVKKFEEGNHPVFLISLKAGGTSLTLTRADYVMHFDPWWNPAVENQATDRAHRIGQMKHVFVYKFYCRGTIEEKILHLQKKKQKMFDDIVGGSLNKISQLTRNDIEDILTPEF